MLCIATIPPEVLDLILNFAVESLFKKQIKRAHAIFSLVCKGWSGVSRRRIFIDMEITGGKKIREITAGFRKNGMGGVIRSLEVVFTRELIYGIATIPTNAEMIEEDMISLDQLIELVKVLPQLTTLRLIRPTFTSFRQEHLFDLSLFPQVTTLHLNLQHYVARPQLLEAFAVIGPNIDRLVLDGSSTIIFNPAPVFPRLRSLGLLKYGIQQQVMKSNNVLPTSSIAGLQVVKLQGIKRKEEDDHYIFDQLSIKFFSIFSSTITTLKYTTCIDCAAAMSIFKYFPHLQVVDLEFGRDYFNRQAIALPENFFSIIPDVIKVLKNFPLDVTHLKYLQANPRPALRIESIGFGFTTNINMTAMTSHLPSSVLSLDISEATSSDTLLGILQSLKGSAQYPYSLSTVINFHRYYADSSEVSDTINAFKALGITLIDNFQFD